MPIRIGDTTADDLRIVGDGGQLVRIGEGRVWGDGGWETVFVSTPLPEARQVTVSAFRDPWEDESMDGWEPGSQSGDIEIVAGFATEDYITDGIVWDIHFSVSVTCPHDLLGEWPETVYPAGVTIPAGTKVNPPVPSEPGYTFTEVV